MCCSVRRATARLTVVLMISLAVVYAGEDKGEIPESQIGEYCQHETMKGRCRWKSEVIVMTSARWGRMKTGRCLNIHPTLLAANGHDPLFLGCSADVLSMVDRKCSGRSECDIRIPDQDLDTVTPCYPDLTRYLDASYTCVKVVQESRSCLVSVTSDQQFISSSSSLPDLNSASSCGSRLHPWRLEAPSGQRVNISLIDFAGSFSTSRDHDLTSCNQYGYVLEKLNKKNKTICATTYLNEASSERETAVYTSDTSNVEVVLVSGINSNNLNYLIKLRAIGCTNMIPPDNAWLKRHNSDIVIGCYLSQQTWHLKCDGHEWKGQFGTCPETYDSALANDRVVTSKPKMETSKMYLLMVVIAGGAVIICVTVIATGVVCLQRCKRNYKKHNDYLTAETNLRNRPTK